MNAIRPFFFTFFLTVCLIPAQTQEIADLSTELFGPAEPLKITIKAELKRLFKDVGDERSYHPATLIYEANEGTSVSVAAELRTRGHFRRQRNVCNLPPIRLKFDQELAAGSLFEGQKKIKLVTVCQYKKDQYEQNLLLEYLIYRTYNILTDSSFRVRLAHITFVDSNDDLDTLHRYSFFIEDEDRMAERLGGRILEINNVHPLKTALFSTARMSVFQYMIGNTDWSITSLHNIRLVGPNGVVPPVAVPYDFDWSGCVSAPYAKPNPQLGLTTVEARLYRGFCRTREEFEQVFVEFRAKKEAIYALYEQCEMLDDKYRERVLKYYDDFYEIINSEKKIELEILGACRTDR